MISIPTDLVVVPQQSLLVPPMAVDPVGTALNNTNYLYLNHTPALISAMPMYAAGLSRDSRWTIPAVPSQDGLRYRFEHRFLPQYNGTITVKVESLRGASATTIYGPTATSAMSTGTWFTHQHYATIAGTEDRIRITYSGASGNYLPGHILVYPAPDVTAKPFASPWAVPSGFRVYEDSLLDGGTTGQPVNTEMLDRCRMNSLRVLRDRWQCCATLLQEDGYVGQPCHRVTTTDWRTLGRARGQLPGQKGALLDVYVLATKTGGAPDDLVRVQLVGGGSATYDASGNIEHSTFYVPGDGSLAGMVEWQVDVRATTGNTTDLQAVVILWRPGN